MNTLAENTFLLVWSRISMAIATPLIAILAWFGANYLETRDQRTASIEIALKEVSEGQEVLANRITTIEAERKEARRANDQRTEQILSRLDRQDQSILEFAKQMAAMTAVMQTLVGKQPGGQ